MRGRTESDGRSGCGKPWPPAGVTLPALMKDFLARGGRIWACTPCVKARGYEQGDLIEGVEIAGSSKIHELIKAGAATLSF